MRRAQAFAVLICAFAAWPALADANLVVNPGFEAGDFTGWHSVGEDRPDHSFVSGPSHYPGWNEWFPRSGDHFAALGAVSGALVLSQTFATTPGEQYLVGLHLGSDGETPSSFVATWNGSAIVQLDDQPETPGHDLIHGPPAAAYRSYDVAVVATGATATIGLVSRNDQGWWALDDVSVTPMPEPTRLASLVAGILALAACAKGRQRSNG